MSVVLLVIGIILFIGLVVVHEYGHFIAARRGGVDVEEFGIFFPPRLYKRRMKGGWNFTINLLPLGGFVKMKGEHDNDTEPGSFGAASLATKSKIMVAGVLMNLATALVIFTGLALVGMPKIIDNQFTVATDTKIVHQAKTSVVVGSVAKDSPAARAGLKADDTILALGPTGNLAQITSADELKKTSKRYAGQTVTVQYKRGAATKQASIALNSAKIAGEGQNDKQVTHKGYLGVSLYEMRDGLTTQRSTWSAPVVAVGLSAQMTQLTFQGLGKAVAGLGGLIAGAVTGNTTARQNGQTEASSQVSGPVGIFVVLRDGSALGLAFIMLIIGLISLTLAIMNILPIPALDGGRLWMTLISRGIFKTPLSAKREEAINAAGFVSLLLLIVVITIVDVKRFF